jgi:hypothetical protein
MKKCNKCKEEKPISYFNKRKRNKDGLEHYCRSCMVILRKKWDHKYSKTDKFKKCQHKYNTSEKGKEKYKRHFKTDKGKETLRKYRSSEKGKLIQKRYNRKNYNSISGSMRARINQSLKGGKLGKHWEELIGYSLEDLKEHLEKLFRKGMNWDNHSLGGWHIDHIKPISYFNIESYDDKDFKKCWVLENLQPLWAEDNMIKGAKINE